MGLRYNRRHLHASVSAAVVIGIAVGWWIGARIVAAPWYEILAFALFTMFAPAVVFSQIDKKYLPPED